MTEDQPKGVPILEFDNFCKSAAERAGAHYKAKVAQQKREKTDAERKADDEALFREAKNAMKHRIVAHLKKSGFKGTDKEAWNFASHEVEVTGFYCSAGQVMTTSCYQNTGYYISDEANERRKDGPIKPLDLGS